MTGEHGRRIVWDQSTYEFMYEATCYEKAHAAFFGKKFSYGAHWWGHFKDDNIERVELIHDTLGIDKNTKVLVAGAGLGMLQAAAETFGVKSWRSFDDSTFILADQHPAVKIYHHDMRVRNKYYDIADWIITEACIEEYDDLSFLERWPDQTLHLVTEKLDYPDSPFNSRTLEEYKAIEPRHLWMSRHGGRVI